MAITAPPQPPLPTDDEITFNTKAGPWLDWQHDSAAEFNALEANVVELEANVVEKVDLAMSSGLANAAQNALDAQNASSTAIIAAGDAEDSKDAAQSAASLAASARDKAQSWAESETEVESGQYSAKHWAQQAADVVTDGVIDDSTTSAVKTWSSQKIAAELDNVQTTYLSGDTATYVTLPTNYTITNYNSFSEYVVQVSAGSVSLTGDTISFTAPATAGAVTLTVTMDGVAQAFTINVQAGTPYIPTPAATPANFGDAFEGGFYAGLYWDQIAQSSSSKTLATGAQSFTVPDMTGAPIVYAGQTLEVRSRANPANKFIGTVTGAIGTTLTLDVTSIGGSGTFSDWSVMSRFRAIFAPKSSGEHAGIALKNANTAFPTGCQSLVDGWTATEAMKNADTSTVYPAAHWARSRNIGGKTDWHIPARDVLELAWRNLKPSTDSNHTYADRPTAQSFDYKRDGAYGDTANTHGTNNNSSPTGSAYTASVPAQTAATAFKTGGAEAFEFGSAYYWSSTEYNASNAWRQFWNPSNPGYQSSNAKTGTFRVRAVRRSII